MQDNPDMDKTSIELGVSVLKDTNILEALDVSSPSKLSLDEAINQRDASLLPQLPPGPKSSVAEAGMNLFKSFLGSGILGLPFAFARTGVLLGSIGMLVICVIVFYCCHLVFLILDDFQKPNVCFQDIFALIMGRRAIKLYNLFLVIVQIGVCASYIIFFTEFFQIVFQTTD